MHYLACLKAVKHGQTLLITPEELQACLSDVFILDIRAKEHTERCMLEGSFHCPWSEVHTLLEQKTLDPSATIIVVCYSGQSSMHVATLLTVAGYHARSLLDGMLRWTNEQRPVKKMLCE
jgi:rhodanese-related sulfurtransferase